MIEKVKGKKQTNVFTDVLLHYKNLKTVENVIGTNPILFKN